MPVITRSMACKLQTNPLLLLHFDINKTLIAHDSVKGESCEYGLLSFLAEETQDVWCKGQPSLSYKDFVYNVLLPGDKNDPTLKALRHEKSKRQSWGVLI